MDARRLELRLLGAALVGLLVALALSGMAMVQAWRHGDMPVASVAEALAYHIAGSRILTGALMTLAAPLLFHLTAHVLRLQFARPTHFLTLAGVAGGALAYSLSFLPRPGLYLAVLIPPFAVFALALLVLRLPAGRSIALSLSHGVLSFAAAAAAIWGLESFAVGTVLNPVSEARAVYRLAGREPQRTIEIHPRRTGSGYPALMWHESGSVWVDRRAALSALRVEMPDETTSWSMRLEPRDGGGPVVALRGTGNPAQSPVFLPVPGRAYVIRLDPAPLPDHPLRILTAIPVSALPAR